LNSDPVESSIEEKSGVQTPAPVRAIKTLEYDNRTSQITRSQMRFFLLLLAVNTFLFAAFICLPSASPFLKQMWSDHEARRDKERDAAKLRKLIDACMNFSETGDMLVYAEPAADAAKLLSEAGRSMTLTQLAQRRSQYGLYGQPQDSSPTLALSLVHWQSPAVRTRPAELIALDTEKNRISGNPLADIHDEGCAFLHQMTTPSGSKRMVWIAIDVRQSISKPDVMAGNDTDKIYSIWLERMLTAYVFDPEFSDPNVVHTSALLHTPLRRELTVKSETSAQLKLADQWRIFAGQPDPSNPSHLTIAYDIDGKPGVIDGWLKDGDRLMLEPRVGRLTGWNSGSEYVWDMTASSAATKPVK
jgi:hypothetical protein